MVIINMVIIMYTKNVSFVNAWVYLHENKETPLNKNNENFIQSYLFSTYAKFPKRANISCTLIFQTEDKKYKFFGKHCASTK